MKPLVILRNIGLGLLALLLLLSVGGYWFLRRPWPQINGQLVLPGLTAPVTVIRDNWGVPHIYAENEADLFFAQGFVTAQDRMWQMEVSRMFGNGTISAFLGPRGLQTDRFIRTMGWHRAAQKDWELLDSEARSVLESYSAGVNAYLETHRGRLPVDYTFVGVTPRPWTPIDSLVWGKTITYNLGGNHRLELLRAQMIAEVGEAITQQLLPPYPEDMPLIIPPEANAYQQFKGEQFAGLQAVDELLGAPGPVWGSNNWVVHGSRTATGMPLLANDTHLNLSMPSIWYEIGLHGGRYDVIGFTFPSVPGVLIGHNRQIAWGASSVNPDVQDLYIERLNDPQNPTQYEYEGQWYDLEVISERIEIKGQAAEDWPVYLTRHGPIMSAAFVETPGISEPLSLRWTALDGSTQLQAILALNRAGNWDEFRAALEFWDSPSLNFVYADVEGNIGYQTPGRIPIRTGDHQGLMPVPGYISNYEWQGFIPFDELPSILNPATGFLASANNKIVDDDYPYLLAYEWDPGYRARRITDTLAANDSVTMDDMRALQADTYSLGAETMLPYLLAIQPENEQQTRALELVRNWDKRYELDRVGGSIFQVWYWFMLKNTVNDDLGDEVSTEYLAGQYERHGTFQLPFMTDLMTRNDDPWFDNKTTPETETRDTLIVRSLDQALEWLRSNYGNDPDGWTWGRLHQVRFISSPVGQSGFAPLQWLFNSPAIPARGDNFSVNAGSFRYSNPFVMVHGTSQRHLVDLADLNNSLMIQTTGQNGNVLHPHRSDFIELWQNVEYHPMLFERQQIEANAEGTLTLTPP